MDEMKEEERKWKGAGLWMNTNLVLRLLPIMSLLMICRFTLNHYFEQEHPSPARYNLIAKQKSINSREW